MKYLVVTISVITVIFSVFILLNLNNTNNITTQNKTSNTTNKYAYIEYNSNDNTITDNNIPIGYNRSKKVKLESNNGGDYIWKVVLPHGSPAINASVYLIKVNNMIRNDFLQSNDHLNYPFKIQETTTDSFGIFYFNNIEEDLYLIHAELENYSSSHITLDARDDLPKSLILKLGIEKTIKGQVVNMAGEAMSNVKVESSLPYLPYSNLFSMPAPDAVDMIRFHGISITDDSGFFLIPGQPISTLYLTIEEGEVDSYSRVLRIIPSDDFSDHLIIMRKKCLISGKITDIDGNPIRNAEIWDISFENGRTVYGDHCVFSNEEGIYSINDSKEGKIYIHVTHPNYGGNGKNIIAKFNNDNICNIVLPDGIEKNIFIRDENDEPIKNIHLHITDSATGSVILQDFTDNKGKCSSKSFIIDHQIIVSVNSYTSNKDYANKNITHTVKDSNDIIIKLPSYYRFNVFVFEEGTNNKVNNFYADLIEGKSIGYEDNYSKNASLQKCSEGKVSWNLYTTNNRLLVVFSEYYKPHYMNIVFSDQNIINREISVDVYLTKGKSLSGMIVDDLTTKPIKDAHCKLRLVSQKTNLPLAISSPTHHFASNDLGIFTLTNIPDNLFVFSVSAIGYATRNINSESLVSSNNASNNIIRLKPSASICGYLRYDSTEPVTSGIVEAYLPTGFFIKKAYATVEGYFVLNDLPPGLIVLKVYDHSLYSLYCWLSKYQLEVELIEGSTIKYDITFKGNSIIRGSCLVNSTEAHGINISLIDLNRHNTIITAETEEEGLYELRPVPEGDYIISAKSGIDGIGGEIRKEIHVGTNEVVKVNFDFEGIALEGSVKDSKRKSIYGSWLTLNGSEQDNYYQGFTDINGDFKFYNLPEDYYTISIIAPGYAEEIDEVIISKSSLIKNYILYSEGILKLNVTNISGNKIPGSSAIMANNEINNCTVLSDSYGLFVFKNLKEGKMTAIAGADGYAPNAVTVGIVSGETIEKDLALQKGGLLALKVKDKGGQPISGALISFDYSGLFGYSWDSLINQKFINAIPSNFKTSGDGTFEIGPLPTGTYILHVRYGQSYWSGEGIVSPGKTTVLKPIL